MSLAGKVAVVTGGSRGIGRAICLRLAEMGTKVVINYVSRPQAAEETKAQVEALGGECVVVQFNVAKGSEVQEAFKQITAECGRIDILVCNAGITRDGLLVTMKEEDWDEVMAVNLKGAFNCIKAAGRPMMKQRWGRIIIITSVVGFAGNAGQANYSAAKAGLVGLTRSSARELASRSITVNCVAPGYIDTEMTSGLPDAVKEKILAEIPLGTLGQPEDIAGAVTYLASDDARYITGQTIHVNGGMFMG
ncbi:MAG: 3-oxoacyl-[acyl-carrier-protein] reductase [Desulfobulbales bacterium]